MVGRPRHEQTFTRALPQPLSSLVVVVRVVGFIQGTLLGLFSGSVLGQGMKIWLGAVGTSWLWRQYLTASHFLCSLSIQESTQGFLSRPWHVPMLLSDVLPGFSSTAQVPFGSYLLQNTCSVPWAGC